MSERLTDDATNLAMKAYFDGQIMAIHYIEFALNLGIPLERAVATIKEQAKQNAAAYATEPEVSQ